MLSFILILFAWVLVGCAGVLRCKEHRVQVEMLIFLLFTPLIPIVAKIFGIL